MPTINDEERDRLLGERYNAMKNRVKIIRLVVSLVIVSCLVFAILSTQPWFIEWIKGLIK